MVASADEQQLLGSSAVSEAPPLGSARRATSAFSTPSARIATCIACTAAVALALRTVHNPAPGLGSTVATMSSAITQLQEQQECQLFWRLKVSDMVAEGWGSRLVWGSVFFERFETWAPMCTFFISEEVAHEWESYGLVVPFVKMPMDEWTAMEQDWALQTVDSSFRVSIRGPWPGEAPDGDWLAKPSTKNVVFSNLAGCFVTFGENVWKIFSGLMSRRAPMQGNYTGLHVRHGDKSSEGPIASFENIMDQAAKYPFKRLYLATDDANIIEEEAVPYTNQGWSFTWIPDQRDKGGEQSTCAYGKRWDDSDGFTCHHHNSDLAIHAAIADTVALGHATVLVGNWNSQFFRLAWLLNYQRRTKEERMEEWCFDVMTGLSCANPREFVPQFVGQAEGLGVPWYLLPDEDPSNLQQCANPFE